jgi:hypothetical protein
LKRILATASVVVLLISGCSPDPIEQYLDRVGDITATMRTNSIAALPNPATPTPDAVAAVNSARRDAASELNRLIPPSEVRPEHAALLLAVSDLAAAGEAFLADASGMTGAEFTEAIQGAIGIDDNAQRVQVACDAMQRRATELGYTSEITC